MQLHKERNIEMHISPVRNRIPTIPPPTCGTVDRVRLIRRKTRQHTDGASITLPLVQRSLISPYQSPLLPALRTQRRWRNQLFLSVKHWRNFFIEREILIGDFEGGRALMTRSFHKWNGKDDCGKRNYRTSGKEILQKLFDPIDDTDASA